MLVAASAHAQLYRWVDPDSGSVKFSSLPPSDARVQAEVVTPRAGALPKAPTAPPAQQVAPLETRWRESLAQLMALSPQALARMNEGLRQQLEAYQALSSELDRIDPDGAARRRDEALALMQRFRQGAAAR